MARVEKVWRLLPQNPEAAHRLAGTLRASPVVAQLLLNRGVSRPDAARRFLDGTLTGLHSPGLLPDVPGAADRLFRAIAEKRRICVYGDYDVDGVTGTAILITLLNKLGGSVEFHVPHRLSEGYGLNAARLRELAANGVSTVVSVDCGIASLEEAEVAREIGLELIITDHHEMKTSDDGTPILPAAAAIVHPRLPGSTYPFGDLSGAGVALKLAWEIARRASGGERTSPELREFLLDAVGLAALGLVADVVPLNDENRLLVKHGLARIAERPSVGLRALLDAALGRPEPGQERKPVTAEDVGFRLGPRLNAAGRLQCARMVVDLLTTTNTGKAQQLAAYLEDLNQQRQTLERKITQQAKDLIDGGDLAAAPGLVVWSPDWNEGHQGVVGIVASRLVETYGRPALVIATRADEDIAVGSGRSVPDFPLHLALKACEEHLIGHGGHAAAAGFKLRPANITALRDAFAAYAAAHFPQGEPPPPRVTLDAEVPLSAITWGLIRDIDRLEPYGAQNPKPKFLAAGLKAEGVRKIGSGEVQKHMDFRVVQGDTSFRAVAWNMADRMDDLLAAGGDCCLAFTPKVNEFRGNRKIELQVVDLKPGKSVQLG
ncbi:MAG TPA: single-stranded-DNA-specific exonuclease RecJ [Urbifossiella sp.]|nr:single-stranded-DNA-specific exonuclease RecJ [Urbifossiella sp.]